MFNDFETSRIHSLRSKIFLQLKPKSLDNRKKKDFNLVWPPPNVHIQHYLLNVCDGVLFSTAIKSTCNTWSPHNNLSREALTHHQHKHFNYVIFFFHSILARRIVIAPSWNLLQLKCKFPRILNRIDIFFFFLPSFGKKIKKWKNNGIVLH